MVPLLIIAAVFVIGTLLTHKTDYQLMKEAEEIGSFTQVEAERYYYSELKHK